MRLKNKMQKLLKGPESEEPVVFLSEAVHSKRKSATLHKKLKWILNV
jgi:hypothetical protein